MCVRIYKRVNRVCATFQTQNLCEIDDNKIVCLWQKAHIVCHVFKSHFSTPFMCDMYSYFFNVLNTHGEMCDDESRSTQGREREKERERVKGDGDEHDTRSKGSMF